MDKCDASSQLLQWEGLQGDVWSLTLPQQEGSGGLDLLLLRVRHPGQEDGQQTREERTQTRGIMH